MLYSYKYLEDQWNKLYWDVILDNLNEDINWYYVFNNDSQDLLSNEINIKSDIDWNKIKLLDINNIDWYKLSSNPNITWEIILNNLNKPWNWVEVSKNINITWEIVHKNPDKKWCWSNLLNNPMTYGKQKWINNLRISIIKAKKIQKCWKIYKNNNKK